MRLCWSRGWIGSDCQSLWESLCSLSALILIYFFRRLLSPRFSPNCVRLSFLKRPLPGSNLISHCLKLFQCKGFRRNYYCYCCS
uniref:Uncharacterized protein n=1 Tax=Ciona intestinalis TaxID=7719 RepID=H2XJX8_CIOIN